MIEPQVHTNGQRTPMVEQTGMAKLLSTLDTLSAGQRSQEARDTEIRTHLRTQAEALARVQTRLQRLAWLVCGLVVLGLGLGGMAVWQATRPAPELAYVRLVGQLDQVLVQQWSTLPKATQEALRGTYERLGLVPPGQRK